MSVIIPQAFKNPLPDSIIHIFQGLRLPVVWETTSHVIQTRLREQLLGVERYLMGLSNGPGNSILTLD